MFVDDFFAETAVREREGFFQKGAKILKLLGVEWGGCLIRNGLETNRFGEPTNDCISIQTDWCSRSRVYLSRFEGGGADENDSAEKASGGDKS